MKESPSHINREIKNLFHLIFEVPFITSLTVLECNGFTRNMNAARPAIKGKSITTSIEFEL
jgi:hypothetical protein